MVSLLDAVLIRRADEQMATAWRRLSASEVLELKRGQKSCAVPGCINDIPTGDRHHVCSTCRSHGYVASPCKGCGGRIRRCDQTGVAESRRGFCAACRGDMPIPLSPGSWVKGRSGDGHKPRPPRTAEQRAEHARAELARYHAKVKPACISAGMMGAGVEAVLGDGDQLWNESRTYPKMAKAGSR